MKIVAHFALIICLVACGCHSTSSKSEFNHHRQAVVNIRVNSYSLLYDLLNDEKNVSKLLLIKHESRELNRLIKDISTASGQAAEQLKRFSEQDGALTLDALNLPPGEAMTRKAIAATKTKELLESSGDTFERALLLTQIQALNYGAHLALVAADNDPDPARAAWSKSLSREMKALYSQCVELLSRTPHGR
jgi:hypothetical protein